MIKIERADCYKWDSPHDWLAAFIRNAASQEDKEAAITELWGIAESLRGIISNDDIQDTFQIEMDQDGYFEQKAES